MKNSNVIAKYGRVVVNRETVNLHEQFRSHEERDLIKIAFAHGYSFTDRLNIIKQYVNINEHLKAFKTKENKLDQYRNPWRPKQ